MTNNNIQIVDKDLIELIKNVLDDKKASNISVIDIVGKCPFADYFIIATATSFRHIKTIAEEIIQVSKRNGIITRSNGNNESEPNWIIVDFGNIFLHVFLQSTREYYQIEDIWM